MSNKRAKEIRRREASAAEQRAAGAATRHRRGFIAGVIAVALAAAGGLAVVSASGGGAPAGPSAATDTMAAAAGMAESAQLLAGIPERGLVLGREDAPLTLVEYADLQCPACRAYSTAVFPEIVQRYVRTGKLRIELRLQSFLGPDSVEAAQAAAAAARQDRAWRFVDLFYRNQGQENSGYVTDGFLQSLAASVPGLNADRLFAQRDDDAAARLVEAGAEEFARLGFEGTPSFRLGPTGGELRALTVRQLAPQEFTAPIDSLLAG
jgi:protein-disulfide isomerase